jgi:hypothetical protein
MTVPDIDRTEPERSGDERSMLAAWLDYYLLRERVAGE